MRPKLIVLPVIASLFLLSGCIPPPGYYGHHRHHHHSGSYDQPRPPAGSYKYDHAPHSRHEKAPHNGHHKHGF